MEDNNVSFIQNDMLKQSEELQQRLAERRRRARNINSCKNSNSKSFFKFESAGLASKVDPNQSKMGLNNDVSIIDNNMSIGLISEDEMFMTEPSSQNIAQKLTNIPYKPKLQIATSVSSEGEEEEEESEDEKIEQNVIDIWNE